MRPAEITSANLIATFEETAAYNQKQAAIYHKAFEHVRDLGGEGRDEDTEYFADMAARFAADARFYLDQALSGAR